MGGLSERLRGETEALHRSAERSRFMGALLRGRMDRPAYCALLLNLHAVYAVLEPALMRHAQHPLIAPVFLPGLWRSAALAADLGALQGSSWAVAGELQSACLRYVQRLCEVDAAQPGLLLAHAYVRYLGDLSGGQMLRRIVADSMKLPPGIGVAFYDFGPPAETLALAQAFRDGLDAVVVDPALADALVAEAVLAFELHRSLFDELAVACSVSD
jgi:heme oxygenase (biliverdin-producing, ferredoxin)